MKSKLLFLLALFLWVGSSWGATVQIGSGTGTNSYFPIYSCYGYNYSQQIYLASEIAGVGGGAGQVNKVRFFYSSGGTTFANWSNWTVYLGNTTKTTFTSSTDWVPVGSMTQVFSGNIPTPVSGTWVEITLTSAFSWDGTSNLVVAVDENSSSYSCTAAWRSFASGSNRGLIYYSDGTNPDPASPPAANYGPNATLAQIQFDMPVTAPSLSVSPASFAFGYVPSGNTYEYPTPYVLSGSNLTAGPIVVTAPAGFEVSLTSGSGFASSVNVSYSPPTLGATNIYVRFAPTGPAANYSGNITNVGGGASANVGVTGTSYLYARYCTSGATSSADEDILNVTLGTLNNTSTCSTTGGVGSVLNMYSNYTTTVAAPDLVQGASVPFSVQIGTCGGNYGNQTRIYIDFNQDGDFLDSGETVFTGISVTGPHTETGNISVPGGATLGNTMMRVVNVEGAAPAPCGTYSWGETEDYLVNIILPPNYQLSWYNLQWPPAPTINQSQNVTVFAQCWESGVTEAAGPGTDILCWIGYNTADTDPNTWTNWVPASYNYGIDPNNNDEYQADLGALQGLTPGTYYFASRFQYKGGIMTYGGYRSGGGGPWDGVNNVSGVLTVTPYIAPLPYSQDFPTGTWASYWTQSYSGGVTGNVWALSNSFAAGGGAWEMKATYVNQIGLTRLISPALDFSTAADPWLSFKTFYDDYGTGVTLKIQTSTDLVNWTDAWTYEGGSGNILPGSLNVELPPTGTSPTYVAWVIDGNHYQFDYWHVDNVLVQDGVPAIPGYWVGSFSDDWFTPGNWADGVVPTSLTNVTIPAGRPNYPYVTLAGGECNKLSILWGGSFRIDSFFDVFTEISVDGGLTIEPNATLNIGTNIQQAGNGVITINGGALNVDGFWGGPLFGGSWGGGILNLNGGIIDLDGYLLLGSTDVRMAGPFEFHVHGNAVRFDGAAMTTTPTGGAFYIEPASSITDVYVYNSQAGVQSFFDIFFDAGTKNVWLNPTSFGPCGMWTRNFTVLSGKVSTRSSDNLTEMNILTVTGDLDVAANNNANFTTQTVPITVTGDVNQGLITGSGYGSIISGGNITGNYNLNVTVNPLVAPGRWILISPPVAGLTAAMFQCQYLQRHDPITNTWIDMIPTDPLVPGLDYALWVHPDPIVLPGDPICPVVNPLTNYTWAGVMNSGLVTAPLLWDGDPNEGWNNVGNPFQATIDWTAPGLVKTNVNDAIYFESNGTWATYIGGLGANGGSQYIAPGQGFFVQCNDVGGGSLGFDPSIRTHTRTAFFKNSVSNMVRLQASGNDRTEETVIRFTEEATAGFDGNYDAHNLETSVIGYPTIPQIYSYADGVVLDINSLPATETVPLGFRAGLEGIYTIEATEIQDMPKVDLEDRTTGIITNLLTNSYSFNYKPGDNDKRFLLHFAPLSVDETGKALANIYALDHTVYVNLIDYTKGDIFIYNVSGQLVATAPAAKGMNKVHLRNSGHYVVKVVTETETLVQKVFINQ